MRIIQNPRILSVLISLNFSSKDFNGIMAEARAQNFQEAVLDSEPDEYLFVVALDFGTTFSGYAFSARSEYNQDPLKIQLNQEWSAEGTQLLSQKTPTSILIRQDGSFIAFGYEAEDMFYSAIETEERENVMLFRRFKMELHNKMVFFLFHIKKSNSFKLRLL